MAFLALEIGRDINSAKPGLRRSVDSLSSRIWRRHSGMSDHQTNAFAGYSAWAQAFQPASSLCWIWECER